MAWRFCEASGTHRIPPRPSMPSFIGSHPRIMMSIDDYQTIQVNGKERTVPVGLDVAALLKHLDLDPRVVVVERNSTILGRDSYAGQSVEAGDRYELVHFVGGG